MTKTVEEFLKTYVEDYLFEDLNAMAMIPRPSNGKTGGGVAYPMVSAALAGIELLGGIMSTNFGCYDGPKDFQACWDLVYQDAERQALGEAVYQLARHGLAHHFLAKPGIVVVKVGAPEKHLRADLPGDSIVLDALVLAKDLEEAYRKRIRPNLLANPARSAASLGEMDRQFGAQAQRYRQTTIANLAKLGRVDVSGDGPTGAR